MLRTLHSKLSVQKIILKNLQSKLLTLLVLSTVVPVSTVGLYGLFSSTKALTDLSVSQIEKDVSAQALRIDQLLQSVHSDVLMLAQMPPIQGVTRVQAGNGIDSSELQITDAAWSERTKIIFRTLMNTRSHYKALRYFDETGRELVCVSGNGNCPSAIASAPKPQTQLNLQADFFQGAIRLKSGQVYISKFEIEPTQNQQLQSDPIIHYSTPIYDGKGQLKGVLVATIFTYALAELMQASEHNSKQAIMLATPQGYYLWNSMTHQRWSVNQGSIPALQNDYPTTISQRLLDGQHGSIHHNLAKIISYETINPGENHEIVIIYDQPKYLVFQSISQFKRLSAGVIALSLGAVLIIGISIVRKLSRSQTMLYAEAKEAAKTAEYKAQQLEQTLNELHKTQSQLVQTEKMSSLGQLVAGVAHEINNPVNFIYGNLAHVDRYTHDILNLVQLYQQHYPKPEAAIQAEAEAIDLHFLIEDMPKMLASMKVGADRIRQIVLSLRNFSRLDEAEMKAVDIHEGIDSTLLILQNRLKVQGQFPGIEIHKEYSSLPLVECYAGQLNQVFMNILSNAIDALEEATQSAISPQLGVDNSSSKPKSLPAELWISIKTAQREDGWIEIVIADNGPGIPAPIRDRLFEPFFTTKPVGRGTGLGLSISYQIVTDKHGGQLRCLSELGKGTEFHIAIPIQQSTKLIFEPPVNSATPASVS